jgi:beta-glucanase (GH16 family)
MMRYWLLLLFISGLFAMEGVNAQDKPVWQDEFNYKGLVDTTKWSYDTGGHGWGNNELQYYTKARKANAQVKDGKLIITARKEDYKGMDYTSARLVTRNKGDWAYGRIEVRAKLPSGKGTWPAIWMLPTDWKYSDGSWPDNGEIDIMEHVGYDPGVVHGTIHTKDFNHADGTQKGEQIKVPDAMDAFHTYAIEWTPKKIKWFVDDRHYFTYNNNGEGWSSWPFDHPFHLILNIAVGGDWGGAEGVDQSIFPVRMEVDYVRVYQ